MNILVISQYFPPDITAAAFRISETTEILETNGHNVRVVTSTPHKTPIQPRCSTQRPNNATRIRVSPLKKATFSGYIAQHISFAIKATLAALRIKSSFDYDVVWVTSPPLFTSLSIVPIKAITRRPVVFDVRDIWPESAVNVGQLRKGSLSELIGKLLEAVAYRTPDAITCVSRPMQDYIKTRTKRPVAVVYNGCLSHTPPNHREPDPSLYCYAGNLGHAQSLEMTLEAFARATTHPSMSTARLRVIGSGAIEAPLRRLSHSLGLSTKVEFTGAIPKKATAALMLEAGTLLIPLQDSPAFALTVPSKVFDYMLAERPIIAALRGEAKDILKQCTANIVIDPGNIHAMANAFIQMQAEWQWRISKAHHNKSLVRSRFSREYATQQLEDVFHRVIFHKSPSRSDAPSISPVLTNSEGRNCPAPLPQAKTPSLSTSPSARCT